MLIKTDKTKSLQTCFAFLKNFLSLSWKVSYHSKSNNYKFTSPLLLIEAIVCAPTTSYGVICEARSEEKTLVLLSSSPMASAKVMCGWHDQIQLYMNYVTRSPFCSLARTTKRHGIKDYLIWIHGCDAWCYALNGNDVFINEIRWKEFNW